MLVSHSLDNSQFFTLADEEFFSQIQENPEALAESIIDNGYSGLINNENVSTIVDTIKISIMSKRRTYLAEIQRGLNLYGLFSKMQLHPGLFLPLFVKENSQEDVDGIYI